MAFITQCITQWTTYSYSARGAVLANAVINSQC